MEENGNKRGGIQNAEGKDREIITAQQVFFAGPLPHPSILKGYEDVVPGAADRIIAMAEKQSGHRQHIESLVLKFDELKSVLGLAFAFLIVLAAFVTGAYTALQGRPLFGGVISLAGLAAVVGPFIYQRRRERGKAN
jgi:uncharacterized membrane protein